MRQPIFLRWPISKKLDEFHVRGPTSIICLTGYFLCSRNFVYFPLRNAPELARAKKKMHFSLIVV